MKLTIDVVATGKTTATAILTQEHVDAIRGTPGRSRVPLTITYKGQRFRTSVSVYNGKWMTVVNAGMREGGLVPGSSYKVDISVDVAERTVEIPTDVAKALKTVGLTRTFAALSYTHRKEHIRAIEDAKKPDTRQRRIEAMIAKLGKS